MPDGYAADAAPDREVTTQRASSPPALPRSGPAVVLAVTGPRTVRLRSEGGGALRDAELAAHGYDEPREGDRVLFVTDEEGRAYVVGVLAALCRSSALHELLEDAEPETAPVRVHDRRGQLIFEYDPATDRAVLHRCSGDLDIEVPQGALRVSTRDGVALASDGKVALRSRRAIDLDSTGADGTPCRATLDNRGLSLAVGALTAAADRAELLAGRVGLSARRLSSHVGRIVQVAEVIDVRATRLVERARDAYREVERLSQHRAGRLKQVARGSATLVGQDTLVKARDRMKIKGEQIHLA